MLQLLRWHSELVYEHGSRVKEVSYHIKTCKAEPNSQFWAFHNNYDEHEVQERVESCYLSHKQLDNVPAVEVKYLLRTPFIFGFATYDCLDPQDGIDFPNRI